MKKIITFACVPSCGKTPVASYLSWKLGLPIFSNDAIRNEVKEDFFGADWIKEFDKRRAQRIAELVATGQSVILDSSVDRRWPELSVELEKNGYKVFIISFNLSEAFLGQIYKANGYNGTPNIIQDYLQQHNDFLSRSANQVNLVIDDNNYSERMSLALEQTKTWLESEE